MNLNVFQPTEILLPKNVCLERWAVIACDQFTSEPDYWERVRAYVGNEPSTLQMILPEAELENENNTAIQRINANMERFLADGFFQRYPNAYIYVERTLANGMIRPGLIGAVDLEQYDYRPGAQTLIRATERTVLERIPPRQAVRQEAALEFSHVLMLCDDDCNILLEPIREIKDRLPKLYDFTLMEGGGHIAGWLLQGTAAAEFDRRLEDYSVSFRKKYDGLPGAPVLLAVGDGNHSLAAAKSCYEALKAAHPGVDVSSHSARWALVELENIHDPALAFEPIHRILTEVDGEKLLRDLEQWCAPGGYSVTWLRDGKQGTISLDRSKGALAAAVLQTFLDDWLSKNPGNMDYIHGEKALSTLATAPLSVGFLLPPMAKEQLFQGVITGGVLPRKTFSMGHAREKRYYLEGRRIK